MQIVDKGILIDKTLVISDLHLGMEEAIRTGGVLLPRTQYKKLHSSLKEILLKTKPEKVIINGDVKHEFGRASDIEWREMRKLFELIQSKAKLILIKGNHDTFTPMVAKKLGVEVTHFILQKDIFICHGDTIIENESFKKANHIIIGHAHPAITLREGAKYEKYKCFLKTTYKKKTLWVLPSFTTLVEGSDILKEKLFSPFLKNTKKVQVIIIEQGQTFPFGEVKLL